VVLCVKDSSLIRICLLGSVAGIAALYFVSFMVVAEELGAGEINQNHAGRKVRVSGIVEDLREHRNGHIFFGIRDETGSVDVVVWEDRVEQLKLSGIDMGRIREGAGIEITGSVELYRGDVQVVL
jgi:DNA/RNA endonuclease YhcR with UshA esterase domain